MCGIAGIALKSSADLPDLRERLLAMRASLKHRGPDDAGLYLSPDGRSGLINCRLAIRDVSAAGHMPMQSERSAAVLSQNGEIYNADVLRAELEATGAIFHSHGDTEVILRGYEAWSEAIVPRLRGIFAFALYDGRRLLLARDPLGVKPLYVCQVSQGVLFASELKGLLASGLVSREVDPVAVAGYLMLGSVPCPRSIFRAVQMLEPAHTLSVCEGIAEAPRRYWNFPGGVDSAAEHPDAAAETRALLTEAVRSQLVSDVPLGVFLSGGLDSTSVVALMRAVTNGPIRTCSMIFAEPGYSEARYTGATARTLGTDHYERAITTQDVHGELERILWAMDQPTIDGVNTYFVSKVAREAGLTVALSGLGGDELFGGYPSTFFGAPRLLRGLQAAHAVPLGAGLARAALRWAPGRARYLRVADALQGQPSRAAAYLSYRGLFAPSEARALLQPEAWDAACREFDPVSYVTQQAAKAGDARSDGAFAWTSRAELRTYTLNQLLRDTDVMSMAHSLEVRVPLLAQELVEAVLRMPAALKTQGAGPKPLLLRAMYDLLPPPVRERRDKQGFSFPFDRWLKGPLGAWFSERAQTQNRFLRGGAVEGLRRAYAGNAIHWSRLWAVNVLQAWLDREASGA